MLSSLLIDLECLFTLALFYRMCVPLEQETAGRLKQYLVQSQESELLEGGWMDGWMCRWMNGWVDDDV